MCMYVCVVPMEARIEADPLELDLLVFVSCAVGGGNQTQVLYRSSQCS